MSRDCHSCLLSICNCSAFGLDCSAAEASKGFLNAEGIMLPSVLITSEIQLIGCMLKATSLHRLRQVQTAVGCYSLAVLTRPVNLAVQLHEPAYTVTVIQRPSHISPSDTRHLERALHLLEVLVAGAGLFQTQMRSLQKSPQHMQRTWGARG